VPHSHFFTDSHARSVQTHRAVGILDWYCRPCDRRNEWAATDRATGRS
jgi:hypothetical protein